ncbi:MAG: hypothetical protein WC656_01350 [Sulfurimonas sp.]|jgi:hypothetical protein
MHYIYNKDGAALALGLSDSCQLKRYKDKAIKAGAMPCKIIGGVELYDIDILMNQKNQKNPAINHHGYKASELKVFAGGFLF